MPGNAAVKSTARAILKGIWPELIACTFLGVAVFFLGAYAISAVSLLVFDSVWADYVSLFIYVLFLFAPLVLGILRFVWRKVNESEDDISTVFYYFSTLSRYLRSLFFSISIGIKAAVCALISFLPHIAVEYVLHSTGEFLSEQMEMHLLFLSAIFFVIGVVISIILLSRYYIAPMLLIACDHIEISEIMHLSKLISRKTAGSYIVLVLGMFGWILLSALGVTLVYTVPYLLTAYAVHCRYAVYYYNHRVRLNNETDFPEFRSSF